MKSIAKRMLMNSSILVLGLFYNPISILAQVEETYEFGDDVKNYSIKKLKASANVTGTGNESIYAGNIFRNVSTYGVGDGSVHILSRHTAGGTWEYDHPDYDDERVMAIAVDNTDNASDPLYYVVSMVRPDPGGSLPFTNRDMIKIVRMDDLGPTTSANDNGGNSVLREATIYESTNTASGTFGSSLYPTDAIYYSNAGRHLLYICGYYVPGNTRTSSYDQPDHTDSKEAFIMSFDVDPNSTNSTFWQVESFIFFNQHPILSALSGVDYDMPLRMTVHNGRIWVTGMTNALTSTALGAPNTFRCATMNIVFEPDLAKNGTPVFANRPFINQGNLNGAGLNEFGTAFYQDPNNASVRYIAGGFFYGSDPDFGGIRGYGYGAEPFSAHITRLDNNYVAQDRVIPDNGPGAINGNLHITDMLLSDITITSPNTNYTRFLLTGLVNGYYNCATTTAINAPFIYDMELQHNTALTVNQPACLYHTYETATGTGTGDNRFEQLGGQFTSSCWLPSMFQREPAANEDVVFTGPREINSKLGLKLFEAQHNSNAYTTPCNPLSCAPDWTSQTIQDPMLFFATSSRSLGVRVDGNPSSFMSNYGALSYEDCTTATKTGTTGIKTAVRKNKTAIYPNPAKNYIKLALANDIADNSQVQVDISDMQGRIVSVLYNGEAGKVSYMLSLPEVATGVYIVNVRSNGRIVHHEKVTIQQ